MKILKQLFCHHDFLDVIKVGEWFPTFHTSNGLDNEDFRDIICRCKECDKRVVKTQYMSHGTIMNHRDLVRK